MDFQSLTTTLSSFGLVFLAEMGDKTQLLALSFAARYRARDIMLGIFAATILNHGLAVAVGTLAAQWMQGAWFHIIIGLLFIGFGVWTLFPDKADENPHKEGWAVATVAVAFFFAEMGDKTQFATASLAAANPFPLMVLMGTTLGMMAADGLAVVLGEGLYRKMPAKSVRIFTAALFFATGLWYIFFP